MKRVEELLKLSQEQRRKTLIRVDAGFGTDANINWLLRRSYQVLAKGYSGKRANAFAREITHWQEITPGKWIAPAVNPKSYYRKTQSVVLKTRSDKGKLKHSIIISSLWNYTPLALIDLYDDRAQIENEIKSDKHGLHLPKRRKKGLHAQEALILLTDLAHNVLSFTQPIWATESALKGRGIGFIVKEILEIPGKAMFNDDKLVKLRLKSSHPLSKPVLKCLDYLLNQF